MRLLRKNKKVHLPSDDPRWESRRWYYPNSKKVMLEWNNQLLHDKQTYAFESIFDGKIYVLYSTEYDFFKNKKNDNIIHFSVGIAEYSKKNIPERVLIRPVKSEVTKRYIVIELLLILKRKIV